MSDRFEVRITGSNQASQAFQSVTRDMETMGRSADATTRRMGLSFDDINKRAFAMGAAIGSATLLLGEWSRAAAEDEAGQNRLQQAIENTGTSYEQYAAAVDRAIEVGQEKAFADDRVREALVRLNAATKDTEVSLSQMGLVMDLARARGIDLATAADIIGKAYNGSYTSLQRMGIQIDANASSMEALATVQRIVAGQAEVYANSDLGWLDRQRIKFDELTESAGAQADEFSRLLMLLPGLSAGYSALAGVLSGLGGAKALATIGAVGVGAAGAYVVTDALLNSDATGSRESFTAVNYALYGASWALNQIIPFSDPFNTQKYPDALASNSIEDVIKGLFYFAPTDNVDNAALFDRLVTAGILQGIPAGAQIKNEDKFYEDQFLALEKQAVALGMSTGQFIESRVKTPGSTMIWDPVSQRYMDLGEKAIYDQTRAQDARRQQAISWAYTGGPQAGLSAGTSPGLDLSGPYFPFREGANPQADFALYSAERQRILAQIDQAALDFISNPGNVSDLLNNWQVMPDAPVFNRRAGGGSGGVSTPFYAAASSASTARDQFETGYRVTIGQTQQIASQSQGLASFAEDLVNYEGVIGRVDDLLNRGVISIDAYRAAQEDANQIFAANAEIQDDVASIQVKQLGYNADLLTQYGETIDLIEQMGEAEQRRALAMMDSGEAAKVNEAATIAYRVAMGELSETIGTDLIEGMARADPLLADILEQYGLIEQGANGEISVIFPEKQNLLDGIADLSQSIQDLVDAIYEVVIEGDNSAAIESIDETWNEVRGLDGASATVKVYADISSAWSSLTALANTAWSTTVYAGVSGTNPSGGSRLHGGVVGYANGGIVARMAEAGPELLRFANGGTAWAMQDGLYNVPRGTYVTPAPASKGQGRSAPSIVISGPVTIVANDPRQLYQSLNEYARGGSRL